MWAEDFIPKALIIFTLFSVQNDVKSTLVESQSVVLKEMAKVSTIQVILFHF